MERDENKMVLMEPVRTTKKLDENEEEPEALLMSPTSRMFHEPNYNVYTLAIMGWKIPLNVDAMKAEIQGKLLKHPRFSSLQAVDESDDSRKMKWVPTTVNIDDHITVPDLKSIPNNMDSHLADKLVEEYISNLSTTTIDMSKPLWDLHILNVKTSHADATCIFRFHHSLGDGVSLISLLLSCFRKTSDPTSLPTLLVSSSSSSKGKSNLSNNRRSIRSLIWQCLVKLWWCIRLLFNTIIDVLLFVATALFLKDSQSPFTVPQGFKLSTRLRFIYRTISLDDIKFIKNSTNSTVNDVILGITQAALSRYIHRRYEIEGKRKFSPQKMRCRANVVVNLRPALGVQTVAEMIEKNAIVIQGNCFGFVIIPLSISQLDNPLDYVLKAKTTMDRKKHSLESRCTFYFSQLLIKLFGFEGATTLAARVLSQTTLIFSNVAGPPEEVSCSGHPLTFLAPTCYGQPTGLMVHGCSYAKKLTFAVAVDEGIIPDPNLESFRLIKEAALSKWRTKVD
ncbi:PREDICTED: O-acyltransferase WSD1-like isoform X1 [Nicotiana attenuata]|uniref:O-acyltransferase wsd1 n=1 Tax=Nicotiana attenuata TaxID=49451 RepID=A0A1J6JKF7_NICAT|nr:PREDICTED: O-acyltransferase WSD1-like isoform X1 [Nicotiana attenuata]OIT07417.1 o-acyltransferase wsd1 [Nicotiana attenuata]